MAPNRLQQAKKLLKEALELDPRKRADFLAEAYAKNDALREEVESLMTSLRYADSALETWTVEEPNITAGFQASAAELSRTQQIGPYRILQELGHGGMGVVYEAEQEKPVQRRVALKLIKWGMDTKAVIGRFESERQALAMMNHPNIARVYDAGATKQGCPYFAMELVRGEPITTYCDKNRLTVRERLNLFIDICEAVQHAHQKELYIETSSLRIFS